MPNRSSLGLTKSQDDECFLKISLKTINIFIATFSIFCLVLGVLMFNRSVNFATNGDGVIVVWNGYTSMLCRVMINLFVNLHFCSESTPRNQNHS